MIHEAYVLCRSPFFVRDLLVSSSAATLSSGNETLSCTDFTGSYSPGIYVHRLNF